ncbi:MAG TPA: pyruvate, phosphate dikinase/phosphoenolpyruvate synthase regulator, partial [Gammaproteobacteria bacterium]|nr:pyruvate, phosphate dikinase/phosphoenolpyruvate synthase regulator [Gammaproteobacteria bacterium]
EIIRQNTIKNGKAPVVFSTLVDAEFQRTLAETDACIVDLFFTFIEPLEKHLEAHSSHTIGKPHEEIDDVDYQTRMDALDFTLRHDDGMHVGRFAEADVIIIGVSRTGKTPTCLYLAMHFSVKAANYPLTDDDLENDNLPDFLLKHRDKIVGLTISPEQLSLRREQRRPNSRYSDVNKCREEVRRAETIMQKAGIMMINSTTTSIEETAVQIIREKKLVIH